MSKALKVIGTIAGAVALIGTAALTFGGTAFAATALGGALGGAGGIAAVAGVVAGVANVGATLLQKPPRAQGSVAQVLIAADAPRPYAMGEGLVGGVLRFQKGYGPTIKKVPNPYRWMVVVYSGGGECEAIAPWIDQEPVSSWYGGYLTTATQRGACPEPAALAPSFGPAPGWTAASRLSGKAAIGWNLKFDKDGKRFASGVPQIAAYGKWERVYDPRRDDTFPGGSGPCRLGDESTYVWSDRPALHAGIYAFGRYQNGKRVMGIGLPADGIDWPGIAAWANVCDVNDWRIFGVVYEGGGSGEGVRWQNLNDIAAAGGAQPVPSAGGKLSFLFSAPKVPLDTITEADLAEQPVQVTKIASFRDRINTITPKYRSPDHNWEMVPAQDVGDADLRAEDGEEKKVEWAFNLVKQVGQAAQLGAYRVYDSREEQPVTVPCSHRLRAYRPGECLELDLPRMNLVGDHVILTKVFDPATMTVTFTFMSETAGKHAKALAATGLAPAAPPAGQTGEERDQLAASVTMPSGYETGIIAQSYTSGATITGHDAGATASIAVSAHDRVYADKTVAVAASTLTGLAFATTYSLFYDDPDRAGGAVVLHASTDSAAAFSSPDHPDRHNVGAVTTPADGAADTVGYPTLPPGWNFYFTLPY